MRSERKAQKLKRVGELGMTSKYPGQIEGGVDRNADLQDVLACLLIQGQQLFVLVGEKCPSW